MNTPSTHPSTPEARIYLLCGRRQHTCVNQAPRGTPTGHWALYSGWIVRPGGGYVKELNTYELYRLSAHLQPLRRLDETQPGSQYFHELVRAGDALRTFRDEFSRPYGICEESCQELLEIVVETLNLEYQTSQLGYQADLIRAALDVFDTVLSADLPRMATYVVPPRGLFSTRSLVDHADSALPASAREVLSDHVLRDLKQAGRCIAFVNYPLPPPFTCGALPNAPSASTTTS